ncbi:hypothetical protein [Endozoicomonas lisbonensis]|uniref:Uncharacterized protein n=1 Tax=Endozoicomonas lisbonensis TaxID=3120522 RepID=A0ABV2SEE9_9GAMM
MPKREVKIPTTRTNKMNSASTVNTGIANQPVSRSTCTYSTTRSITFSIENIKNLFLPSRMLLLLP